MSSKKKCNSHAVLYAFLLTAMTVVIIVGIVLLIKYKNDATKAPENTSVSASVVSISFSEEGPVVVAEEPKVYVNLAATYVAPDKQISTMIVHNADGSIRNEYHYDEYGRLLYFYSHSSVSETVITYEEDMEILSTYTNSKHFGNEYYDLNHNLIRFENIKNGYEYNYEYNDAGKLLSESYLTTTGASRLTTYAYNDEGLVSSTSCILNDVLNSVTEYYYSSDLLSTEKLSTKTTASEWVFYITLHAYDSNGKPASSYKYLSDENGTLGKAVQWMECTYDEFGRTLTTEKTSDSADRIYVEKYAYDTDGLSARCDYFYKSAATGEIDPLFESGFVLYTWDTAGNVLIKEVHPDSGEITKESFEYSYDEDYCITKQINYFNDVQSSSYEYTYFE